MNPDQPTDMPSAASSTRSAARSPLIDPASRSDYGATLPVPKAHTAAELATLIELVHQAPKRPSPIATVSVGHSRHPASCAAARAFIDAWSRHGEVITVVDWPETAASWLRPATRLTAQSPDAWVIAATPVGFAQLARRLRHLDGWDPTRTVAFASLQDPRLPALAGADTLNGLRGATSGGSTWQVHDRWIRTYRASTDRGAHGHRPGHVGHPPNPGQPA